MSTLREKASQFISEQGVSTIAEKLGKKESTVAMWARTGNYPIDLIELMQGQEETPTVDLISTTAPRVEPQPDREWTPEDLDNLEIAVVNYGEKLQELNLRVKDLEDRHNPKPAIPQVPSATVPPAPPQDEAGLIDANRTRPGSLGPTPRLIRGEAPPAMTPSPQMAAPAGTGVARKGWLEPYDYRERRR